MYLYSKQYKLLKTKQYLKNNKLIFFFYSINRKSSEWMLVEQNLKKLKFNYYKVFNQTTKKTLNNSIYKNITFVIKGVTFLIKPIDNKTEITKQIITFQLKLSLFTLFTINLNNKIYAINHLKNTFCLNYKNNSLLFYHFKLTVLKMYKFKTKKLRNNVI